MSAFPPPAFSEKYQKPVLPRLPVCCCELATPFYSYLCTAMMIQVMKSKLHRVSVTEADLNYIGSVTIDEDLMDAANLLEHEHVTDDPA